MSRIKRWLDHRRVVWSEPALPKYIKINPNSPPGAAEGLQPGDMSMLKVAEEFLEEPEEGPALPYPRDVPARCRACWQDMTPWASGCHLPSRSTRHIVLAAAPGTPQERTRSFQ